MDYELELQCIGIGDATIELFVPKEESVKRVYLTQKEENASTPFPYWAKVWPSAMALSSFIQQHPYYVNNKEVLELAAGLGLPSLLAARHARSVCCSDYLPEPLQVVTESIAYNKATSITTRLLDWQHLPPDLFPDVLLLSDINYDPEQFDILYGVLSGFLQKKAVIMLSTPQRLMAKPFIERLLPWCTYQEELVIRQKGEDTPVSVYVLKEAE